MPQSHIIHRVSSMTISLLACVMLSQPGQAQIAEPLSDTLRHNDEALLEAVHRGNRALWSEMTTPDFMYVEDGEVMNRTDFLRDLSEDGLLALKIKSFHVTQLGQTAVVLHYDDLSPRRERDVTRARFVMTETWQRTGGVWKLRLVHVDRIRMTHQPFR